MEYTPTSIPGLLILQPKVFGDERGFFFESYSRRAFLEATGLDLDFVQHNHSRSSRGVLRGLHYQLPPHEQGKLVRVASGAIWDVAVDVRPGSPSFGRWEGVELSAQNQKQLWLPPGFAHGFLVLSDIAEVLYMTTSAYAPQSEASVRWDDPALAISWPDVGMAPLLSPKDLQAPSLKDAKPFAPA
ncbi:MAG: dTDP-4-dehydrorhamnose 3,5-epimerase [Burkholderiaceae bacterium]|nr:dTDP-4-dehydrorhamnose 3,5-epimerase [Burkholderiaceae bacterium]